MTYMVFETLINLCQSIIVTAFLIKCLHSKRKDKERVNYIIGVLGTFIYLEISNYVVFFESVGIYAYMIFSLIFSFALLSGTAIEKIFYNILMLCGLVGASLLGGGIVSLFTQRDYLDVVAINTSRRYITVILVQIILILIFSVVIKFKNVQKDNDSKYMIVMTFIPAVSVIICCLIVYRADKSYEINVLYTYIAVIGVIIVNIISLILLKMEQKIYDQKLKQQIMISAYQQKEKDIETILDMQKQGSKQRHEFKNIIILMKELIHDGNYEYAEQILDRYVLEHSTTYSPEIVSNNIVINYLLNRKLNQCKDCGIDMSCYVLGNISGVDDMDMYILLENLCDNAIEASEKCDNPVIQLQILPEGKKLYIEIGNSTKENVLKNNPDMNTTKEDTGSHGFGLMNVRDIIEKYEGKFNYEQQGDNYLLCKAELNTICQ